MPPNSTSIGALQPVTHNNKPWYFIKWQDGNTSLNRTVSLTSSATYTSYYKGIQLSNQTDAFNSNSQRKAVRLEESDYMVNVYKSLDNNVWIEQTTDNGQTWGLKTYGVPFDDDPVNEYSSPSVDYIPWEVTHSFAAVVYNALKLSIIRTNVSVPYLTESLDINWAAGTTNITPVVAVSSDHILIVCNGGEDQREEVGLLYLYGTISLDGNDVDITWTDGHIYPGYKIISGTNSSSTNPTIVADKDAGNVFHIAWQQGSSSIKYCKATGSGGTLSFSSVETPSTSSGYGNNQYPSISLANGNPVLSWTGSGQPVGGKIIGKVNKLLTPKAIIRRRGTSWGDFQVVGSNVNYTNNNSASTTQEKTVIIWSEGSTPQSKWITRTGSSYSYPLNLSNSGIQAQVIGGSTLQGMSSIVFNDNQQPYYFKKSTTNFDELGKVSSLPDTAITFGRAGIVNINGVDFVFNTGDVLANGNAIRFTRKLDSIVCTSGVELNRYTRTESFQLNGSSSFYFSNIYYVLNKETADTLLTEEDNVNFRVELVRVSDGSVAGVFDNIDYNLNSLKTLHTK